MKKINWSLLLIVFLFIQKVSAENHLASSSCSGHLQKEYFASWHQSSMAALPCQLSFVNFFDNTSIDFNDIQDTKNKSKGFNHFVFVFSQTPQITGNYLYHPVSYLGDSSRIFILNSVFRL